MNREELRTAIERIPVVGCWIILVYRKATFKPTSYFDSPDVWIERLLREQRANIVQIGSNDGVTGDPIHGLIKKNKKWQVLLVEPIPYLFNKLKNNYGSDPRFSFENVAINDGSRQIFYSVKQEAKAHIPALPDWYDQLGSFEKENILKHLDGSLEPYIEETLLSGMALHELFRKNNVTRELTLLHIDAEGYDWKILSQLDLDLVSPHVILFEHKHLTNAEREESIHFLRSTYSIFELGGDLICLSRDRIKMNRFKLLRGKQIT